MTAERLTEAQLDDVAELERMIFSEPWSRASLGLLLTDEAVGFVCLREGRAVAYGGMLVTPFEGQVTNIAVHPNARRQGLGKAVVGALITEAKARGLEQISLEVRQSNAAAIALYEAFGFYRAGVRKRFYKNPAEDALVMLLDLSR